MPAPTAAENPPPPPNIGAQQMTMERLVEKEREVAQRLQSLKERKLAVQQALASLQPNWPGHCLCIGPIVYHDIKAAVSEERQGFAQTSYTNYFVTIFLLLYNLVVCIAGIASESRGGDQTPYGTHLGIGFLHLLGIPGAFMVWHFQVYKAVQPQGALNRYSVAYLGLFIALFYDIFMAVGVTGYGGAGWLFCLLLKDAKANKAAFYMCLGSAILWTVQALFFIYMIWKLRQYHNVDKAAENSGAGGAKDAMPV